MFWLIVFLLITGIAANAHHSKNNHTASFIAKWEGKRNRAYKDSSGQPTICYGTSFYTPQHPVKMGDYRNDSQCYGLLLDNIRYKQNQINRYYPRFWHLNQNQRTALTSLVFNIGVNNFAKSRTLACLQKGCTKEQTAQTFLGWVKDGKGRVLTHLQKRRQAEVLLYLK